MMWQGTLDRSRDVFGIQNNDCIIIHSAPRHGKEDEDLDKIIAQVVRTCRGMMCGPMRGWGMEPFV